MIREGLTFDDVLLTPQHSTVKSRSDIDLTVKLEKKGFNSTLQHPVVPANMQTVIGYEMAEAIYDSGGLGIVHRFMSTEDQLGILNRLEMLRGRMVWNHIGLSVGVKDNDKDTVKYFVDNGVEILCVDVAHGDSQHCVEMTQWIAETYPEVLLISGNVATGSAAERLWRAGADIVKVGVGPGSLCTTRIETGNGVPQLTALMDVADRKDKIIRFNPLFTGRNIYIMADGGIKNAGDMVKALCFSDMVMAGNIFAGSKDAPGKTMVLDGICYKEYVGSSTHKANHIEGIAALVPCKDSFGSILIKLLEGIRSGCSYQGAHSLTELREHPEFIRITNAGLKESHPHDVVIK
jgi:IMP dehydrogenase